MTWVNPNDPNQVTFSRRFIVQIFSLLFKDLITCLTFCSNSKNIQSKVNRREWGGGKGKVKETVS